MRLEGRGEDGGEEGDGERLDEGIGDVEEGREGEWRSGESLGEGERERARLGRGDGERDLRDGGLSISNASHKRIKK